MCFNVFNACNKSASAPASRLCYEDCHLFDKVHCKYEVQMASKHSSAFDLLPDCNHLPRKNELCEPMRGFLFGMYSSSSGNAARLLYLLLFNQLVSILRVEYL